MTDLILAVAHHMLVFGLVAMLAIERGLLRGEKVDAGAFKALVRAAAALNASGG